LNNNKLTTSSATVIAHAGSHPEDHYGFVNPPIYRGSTVVFPSVDCMQNGAQRYQYGRWNNPSTEALCEAISTLEGATGAVLCPSGLSACVTAILSVVGSSDHILVPDSVYAPTRHFLDTAGKRLGIQTTYYDPQIGAGISELFQSNTATFHISFQTTEARGNFPAYTVLNHTFVDKRLGLYRAAIG